MNRRPLDVEIIEVLDPDDPGIDQPGARAGVVEETPAQPAPPPRRGRTVIGAVLAIAVVGSVAWWWPDSEQADLPDAAPSTTIQTGPLRPPTGYYMLDNPQSRGLQLYSVDIVSPPARGEQFQLWQRVDGARDASLLMHSHEGDSGYAIRGGVRKVLDDYDLVDLAWGGTFAQVISQGLVTDVEALGIPDLQVVGALQAIERAQGLLGRGRAVAAVNGDFEMVAKGGRPEELIFGMEQTRVRYALANATVVTLHVGTGSVDARDETMPFVGRARDEIAGFETGILPSTDETYVAWNDGNILLTLTGPIQRSALVDIARTVKAVDPGLFQQHVVGVRPDLQLAAHVTTHTGVDANGDSWSAGVQRATSRGTTFYMWWWSVPGRPTQAASLQAGDLLVEGVAETIIVPGATYVFMAVPPDFEQPVAGVIAADGTRFPVTSVMPYSDVGLSLAVVRVDIPGPTRPA